jgi:hypothetical protein
MAKSLKDNTKLGTRSQLQSSCWRLTLYGPHIRSLFLTCFILARTCEDGEPGEIANDI